eukprot:scaffold74348_cov30-Prasinocladus_malaysianus.AAC.1
MHALADPAGHEAERLADDGHQQPAQRLLAPCQYQHEDRPGHVHALQTEDREGPHALEPGQLPAAPGRDGPADEAPA